VTAFEKRRVPGSFEGMPKEEREVFMEGDGVSRVLDMIGTPRVSPSSIDVCVD